MATLQHRTEELLKIADEMDAPYLIREAKLLRDKVAGQQFYVVVVGMFKRGKSSLINALLGAPLVPVSVRPLTSVITFISYNKTPGAEITFKDGRKLGVSAGAVDEYISEELNPKNEKQVDYVTIFSNSLLLDGLTLVDTPGLGSVHEHNTETTLGFIPKIDVALLVMSADTPVSKADMDFLSSMQGSVGHFLFVLNKADLLPPSELSGLLSYNKSAIADKLDTVPELVEIYPVCAIGSQAQVSSLMNMLMTLKTEKKDEILLHSTERQIDALKKQCLSFLQMRMDMLLLPVDELQQKIDSYSLAWRSMIQDKSEFDRLLQFETERLGEVVYKTINEKVSVIEQEVYELVDRQFKAAPLDTASIFERREEKSLLSEAAETIKLGFEAAQREMEEHSLSYFDEILDNYKNRGYFFLQQMSANLSLLMNVDFDDITSHFDLKVYTSTYISLDMSDITDDIRGRWYYTFFSKSRKQRLLQADLKKHYRQLIVSNAAGIIYDLKYKIQESLRKFNYALQEHFEELLKAIEQEMKLTLDNKTGSFREVQDKVSLQQERIYRVEQI